MLSESNSEKLLYTVTLRVSRTRLPTAKALTHSQKLLYIVNFIKVLYVVTFTVKKVLSEKGSTQ